MMIFYCIFFDIFHDSREADKRVDPSFSFVRIRIDDAEYLVFFPLSRLDSKAD